MGHFAMFMSEIWSSVFEGMTRGYDCDMFLYIAFCTHTISAKSRTLLPVCESFQYYPFRVFSWAWVDT